MLRSYRSFFVFVLFIKLVLSGGIDDNKIDNKIEIKTPTPCTCGIFLNGQFIKNSSEPPKGNPVLLQETETHFLNGPAGLRMCMSKCLEMVSRKSCIAFSENSFHLRIQVDSNFEDHHGNLT